MTLATHENTQDPSFVGANFLPESAHSKAQLKFLQKSHERLLDISKLCHKEKFSQPDFDELLSHCVALSGKAISMNCDFLAQLLKKIDNFCKAENPSGEYISTILNHLGKAIDTVIEQEIIDDGGLKGQELLAALDLLINYLNSASSET